MSQQPPVLRVRTMMARRSVRFSPAVWPTRVTAARLSEMAEAKMDSNDMGGLFGAGNPLEPLVPRFDPNAGVVGIASPG